LFELRNDFKIAATKQQRFAVEQIPQWL
jgi:hypothetical protein